MGGGAKFARNSPEIRHNLERRLIFVGSRLARNWPGFAPIHFQQFLVKIQQICPKFAPVGPNSPQLARIWVCQSQRPYTIPDWPGIRPKFARNSAQSPLADSGQLARIRPNSPESAQISGGCKVPGRIGCVLWGSDTSAHGKIVLACPHRARATLCRSPGLC